MQKGQARCYCSFLFLAVVLFARFIVLCVLCYDVFFVATAVAFFCTVFLCVQVTVHAVFVVVRLWPPFLCFDFCCSFVVLFVCFVCFCLFFALLCLLCFVCFV